MQAIFYFKGPSKILAAVYSSDITEAAHLIHESREKSHIKPNTHFISIGSMIYRMYYVDLITSQRSLIIVSYVQIPT